MSNRIVIFVLVSAALSAVTPSSSSLTRDPRFESWLAKHGKAYNLSVEKELRFQIYYGNAIYMLKLNRYADLSLDEYMGSYRNTKPVHPRRKGETESVKMSNRYSSTPKEDVLPESVDWRVRGAVAPVKDQGACGGSWAFSTIGPVEAIHHITTGELVTLSEQQLLDCDTSHNKGCNGGDKDHAFANQPVSVSIQAGSKDLQFYSSGIFTGKCGIDLDHDVVVVVVGYGTEAGGEYWLVGNSWGADWGEQGYMRIERTGKCGIAMEAIYPVKNGQNPNPVTPRHLQLSKEGSHVVKGGVRALMPTAALVFLEAMIQVYFLSIVYHIVVKGDRLGHPGDQIERLSKEGSHELSHVITILSIDGGGVRALMPTAALVFLEARIQALLGKNVRLANVFDVITGTSTGGLVTAMLTAPDKEGRPMFTAKEVQNFYLIHAPKIFPPGSNHLLAKVIKALRGPKYDGVHLHKVIREQLEERRLHDTITNVVIPTFDIKTMLPVIFSSFQSKINQSIDAKLSDICIATSAAPTYLPSHVFHYKDSEGNILREFNLIDGGVVANNPAMVAIAEVIRERTRQDSTWSVKDYQFLVLSLGTGCKDFKKRYAAINSSTWGAFGWFWNGGSSPLLDVISSRYSYMADYFPATFLKALNSRIQDIKLSDEMASMDLATDENLENLVEAGEKLLKKQVTRMNSETGEAEPDPHITNEMALESFSTMLRDIYWAKVRDG